MIFHSKPNETSVGGSTKKSPEVVFSCAYEGDSAISNARQIFIKFIHLFNFLIVTIRNFDRDRATFRV
jgi:hypothetical protein